MGLDIEHRWDSRHCALAVLMALQATTVQAADLKYKVEKLPYGGGNSSEVYLVNDRGHAVIESFPDYGSYTAWFWSDGAYQYMAYEKASINALALNNHDQVLGVTDDGLDVIWSPGGVTATFAAPDGYEDLQPRFIDDTGQVLGTLAESGTRIRHAFHLSPAGQVIVDRPEKSVCPVAADSKGRAVMQTMASPSLSCSCGDPHSDYDVRGKKLQRIRIPQLDNVCVYGVDLGGDVLVTDDQGSSLGMWSPSHPYVPIDIYVGQGNIVGIADGGVAVANGSVNGKWQAFLWDRKSGAQPVTQFLHAGVDLDGVAVTAASPHGVLGGAFDRNPVILLPSKWGENGLR